MMYEAGKVVTQDFVLAHMWYDIATIDEPSFTQFGASDRRDVLAALSMTPAQIEEAQSLARKCVEQEYRDCDKLRSKLVCGILPFAIVLFASTPISSCAF